jgi:hypothetical protein
VFVRSLRALLRVVGGVGAAAVAAADDPTLSLEVSPSSVRVGDRVDVVVSARGGGDGLWGEPTVAVTDDGPWALVDGPTAVAGARPPAWTLVLAPLELGEQSLPNISVSLRMPDGEPVTVTGDAPPAVEVVSVLPEGDEPPEPAPLRDPIGVAGFPWEWVLPALVVLLPLGLAAAWWWRSRGSAEADARPSLPPLAELEALARTLGERAGREPADGVCDRLAAGLRRYLERRTGEPAGEMTSFELRLLARRRGWPETSQRLVQRVMHVADGVRFGRRTCPDDELRGAIGGAVDAARSIEAFLEPADRDDAAVGEGA